MDKARELSAKEAEACLTQPEASPHGERREPVGVITNKDELDKLVQWLVARPWKKHAEAESEQSK